jgi:tRNA G18 (ribose-2'-O)-methylase SpoU
VKARLASLLIAALPLAFVLIAACGDGDGDGGTDPVLDEYFQQLVAIDETAASQRERLQVEYEASVEAAKTEKERMTAFQEMEAGLGEVALQTISGLENIEPPPTVRQLHTEWVAIQVEVERVLSDVIDEVQRSQTTEELAVAIKLLEAPATEELRDRGREVCFALQTIADENGIDADLGCSEI